MLIYPPYPPFCSGSEESNIVTADDDNIHEASDAHEDPHEATMIKMTETSLRPAAAMATKKPPTAPAPPATNIALYHINTHNTSVIVYYEEDDISYAKAAVLLSPQEALQSRCTWLI